MCSTLLFVVVFTALAALSVTAGSPAALQFHPNNISGERTFSIQTAQHAANIGRDYLILSRGDACVKITFANVLPGGDVEGTDPTSAYVNYFSREQVKTDVRGVKQVWVREAYSGVDIRYYVNDGELEYDFLVKSGADPRQIAFEVEGAKSVSLHEGDLIIGTADGHVVHRKPVVYQDSPQGRLRIPSEYVLQGRKVHLKLGRYDLTAPLTIDPSVAWVSRFGGTPVLSGENERPTAIRSDVQGNIYVTGWTATPDFPTKDGYQSQRGNNWYAFVMKFDPSGNLVFSTFVGTTDSLGANERPSAIALDREGNIWVAGTTNGSKLPTTPDAWIPSAPDYFENGFLFKLSNDGRRLLYSTYFGPSKAFLGVSDVRLTVDASGNPTVIGTTRALNYPTTPGAFQTTVVGSAHSRGFVTKFRSNGEIAFSTYVGVTSILGVEAAADGSLYLTGQHSGYDPPDAGPPFTNKRGSFVAKMKIDGTGFLWLTYPETPNGPYTVGSAIRETPGGKVYVGGGDGTESKILVLGQNGTLERAAAVPTASSMDLNADGAVDVFGSTIIDQAVSPDAIAAPHSTFYRTTWGRLSADLNTVLHTSHLPSNTFEVHSTGRRVYFLHNWPEIAPTPFAFKTQQGAVGLAAIDMQTSCPSTVNPATLNFDAAGGSASVSVQVAPGCTWVASPGDLATVGETSIWPRLDRTSATGNGSVVVIAHPSVTAARTHTVSIAGKAITISQANGCTYAVTPGGLTISADAASFEFKVETGFNCRWTYSAETTWIRGNSELIGPHLASFSVDYWPGPGPRTGFVTIAGQKFPITQSDSACVFSVSPAAVLAPAAGGILGFLVTTRTGCPFTVNSSFYSGLPSYSGAAAISVPFLANTGSVAIPGNVWIRSATSLRSHRVTVLQQPATRVKRFEDVPLDRPEFDHIAYVAHRGVTQGCAAAPARYCPDDVITREQMAAFLVRAYLKTEDFSYWRTPYFEDVPESSPQFKYVQKLFELGITVGCSTEPRRYCPGSPVSRNEMALFLNRATSGQLVSYVTPESYFQDVPNDGSELFRSVQRIRDMGITTGCAATRYCGTSPTTRAQMSVFVTRALLTP